MRIVFAIERFDPDQGGAEKYAWDLGGWLLKRGHELVVLTQEPPCALAGAEVRQLHVGSGQAGRQLRFTAAIAAELAGLERDVVHGFNHAWPADIIMLHGGVHAAFEASNLHSVPAGCGRAMKRLAHACGRKYAALRENEQRQFDNPDRLFACVSRKVADDIACWFPAAAARCRVLPPGVDAARFHPDSDGVRRAAARRELGLKDDPAVLLFVAHNFRLKGLFDILRALPRVKARMDRDCVLLVAGRGKRAAAAAAARRAGMGDAVRFLGPRHDMPELYAAADVLLHPTYYDTLGGVVLEAAASGLPVLVSRQAGIAGLLHEGEGVRIVDQPCGREGMADAILSLLTPQARAAAREEGAALAARYPVDAAFEAMEDLYREVVSLQAAP